MRLCFWLMFITASMTSQAETLNDDLPLSSATYLGGNDDDAVIGVAYGAAGDLFVAGNFSTGFLPAGATFIPLDGQGVGCVLRLSADGREVLSLTRFDEAVVAFAASSAGFAVALEQSVLLLNEVADTLLTGAISFTAKRIDFDEAGRLAALSASNDIHVYDVSGQLLADQGFGQFTRLDDISFTPQGNVAFTGYNQLNANLKSPVLECYQPDLVTRVWKAYGFTNTEVTGQSLGADSEGERIAMGADGMLYFGGATDGGNTVYQRMPGDIGATLNSWPTTILEQTDNFNRPVALSGSAKFSFHARFDPATGEIQKAQFLLARLSSGSQNTIRIREITADTAGNVLLVGRAFADIEDRDQRTINGDPVGGYAGGNMFALVVESAYRDRIYWTSFNGSDAGQSEGFAVAAKGDITRNSGGFVFAGDVFAPSTTGRMITSDPTQPSPGGNREAYLAVNGASLISLQDQWPNGVDVRDLIGNIGLN